MKFSYSMPTEIYFGRGCIEENKSKLLSLGTKALIITGKGSSKRNGSLDDIIRALESLKIPYVIFDDVEENPSLETVEKASALGKENRVDFIIGIGGGSPLDAAKAIAVFIKNPSVNMDNIFSSNKLQSIPVVSVPTTSGTGSEVTQYSIVTVHKEKTKKNLGQVIFPSIAFVDSRYTDTIPYQITVNTSIDAFTHLVESYLNTNSTYMSDTYVEKGLEAFKCCFEKLVNKDLNEEFRDKVMAASLFAGIAISQTGTSLPHGMGYSLTYFKNLPHGLANGVLTVEYLKSFKDKTKINRILEILDLNYLDELKNLFDKLFEVKIELSEDEIHEYALGLISNKGKLKNHPEEIDIETIEEIYRKSLCSSN